MKSATSFAREQRPVKDRSPAKPKQQRPKSRLRNVKSTPGEWQASGLAVIQDEVTIAVADIRRIPPEVACANIRIMANAKRLDALARTLLNTFPAGSDDVRIAGLLDMAQAAIGGTNG